MAEYDKHNLFDTELILDYLDGILLSDAHQVIDTEMQSSESFKTFVEGVKTTYQEAGNDRAVMQANLDKEKAISLNRLRDIFPKKTNPIQQAIEYTTEQLIQFFTPYRRYDMLLNVRTDSFLSQPQQEADATNNLLIEFRNPTSSPVKCTIIDNENNKLPTVILPANTVQHNIDISQLRPGVYYLNIDGEDGEKSLIRFYIQKVLKP